MDNFSNGPRGDVREDHGGALFEVVFVGSGIHHSLQTARHLASEFHVHCHRFETIDHVDQAARGKDSRLRLMIVDQDLVEDLLRRPEVYRESAGPAALVLAYRRPEVAADFLHRWTENAGGKVGFLPMNVSVDVWLSTLRLLLHRHVVVPAELLQPETATLRESAPARIAPTSRCERLVDLTSRERQVLCLLAQGESNKRIAGELSISEHTVKLHVHNLVKKMGVQNRTAAAAYFVQASR